MKAVLRLILVINFSAVTGGCVTGLRFPLSTPALDQPTLINDLRSESEKGPFRSCALTRPADTQFVPSKLDVLAGEISRKVPPGEIIDLHTFDIEIASPFRCRLVSAAGLAAISYPAALAVGDGGRDGEGVHCHLEASVAGRRVVGKSFIPAFDEIGVMEGAFPSGEPLGPRIQEAIEACVADAFAH
jgi:hypothetical protein